MAAKRHRDDDPAAPAKRQRSGFTVGPANLPDGTHRRKVQKIKKGLVDKAKLKKKYSKIRERELADHAVRTYDDEEEHDADKTELATAQVDTAPASLEPHPDRQRLQKAAEQEGSEHEHDKTDNGTDRQKPGDRRRRPKPRPFAREAAEAQKRKEEAEARRKAREEAEAERGRKIAERERFRKAMAKARSGGPNGQRRLGREGPVLLEKVKRMVG